MPVVVILKLSAADFDALRVAVETARVAHMEVVNNGMRPTYERNAARQAAAKITALQEKLV